MIRAKIFQRYLLSSYIKNFFILFLALEFFYLGIDLLQYFKKLPDSANLQILYALYTFLNAINYTLPISIILAMIMTKFYLIRTNEIIALYASGISKNQVIKPIFLASFFITFIYIMLNFTNFTYSREYAHNILTHSSVSNSSKNLFLKYNNSYIYIQKLNPLKKSAEGIKIFDIKNGDLRAITDAKSANFLKDYWILNDVTVVYKPSLTLKNAKLKMKHIKHLKTLKEFKPKIIENIYDGKNSFSITDAFGAIKLFLSQNVNIQKIRASLFLMVLFPLFAPLLNLILFYYMPISNRFFDLAILSSFFVFVSLATWAVLFMLVKMSLNGVILPEVGIALPIFLLSLFSIYLYIKNK